MTIIYKLLTLHSCSSIEAYFPWMCYHYPCISVSSIAPLETLLTYWTCELLAHRLSLHQPEWHQHPCGQSSRFLTIFISFPLQPPNSMAIHSSLSLLGNFFYIWNHKWKHSILWPKLSIFTILLKIYPYFTYSLPVLVPVQMQDFQYLGFLFI